MRSLTSVILKSSKRNQQLSSKATLKEKVLYLVSFIIVFGFLAVTMVAFSITITKRLIKINQPYTFINLLLLMNFVILFTKSIFESLNVLYFSKDLKMLLRMPVNPIHIVHAKLLNMIISEYQMEIIMLGIPMVVYGILMKTGFSFYFYMVVILLLIPIIPILITTLVISIIMRFTNLIKNKSKVIYITIILAIFLIGFITMGFSSDIEFSLEAIDKMILSANGISFAIADYFVLLRPIMYAMINYNTTFGLKYLFIYFIETMVLYVAVLWIISKVYLKGAIGTILNSQSGNSDEDKNLSLEDFKERNRRRAYLSKEFQLLKRTPIFAIQCLIVPIIYPITILLCLFVLLIVARIVGVDIIGQLYDVVNAPFGCAIFIAIGQIFNMMNFGSIIAVSKESKNAILSKYIPMDLGEQFDLKITLGRTINLLNSIIVAIAYFSFTYNWLVTLAIFVCMEFANVVGEKFKLFVDLRNPQLTWDSEYTMMKQNTNVMYVLFYTLLTDLIILAFGKVLNSLILFLVVFIIGLYIINFAINRYVNENEEKIFRRLY